MGLEYKSKADMEAAKKEEEKMANNPSQSAVVLICMTDKEAEEYISELVSRSGEGLQGLEVEAFRKSQQISQQAVMCEKKIGMMVRQMEAMKNSMQQMHGQIEAYTSMLLMAEDARRSNSKKGE